MDDFAALVGLDWSDSKHDIALLDTTTGRKESSVLKHSAHAIDEWATSLRVRFGGKKIAVCLEPQSRAFDLRSVEV